MTTSSTEVNLVEKWIQQWGCAVSEAILDYPSEIFQTPNIEGFIGYHIESFCAVAIGDPVCSNEDVPALTHAFYEYCQNNKFKMIFLITSERFAKWMTENLCQTKIEMGEELIFDPQFDPKVGPHGSRLRNYISHTKSLGLTVQEYLEEDKQLEQSIQEMGIKWKEARKGPQMYLGHLDFFSNKNGKRWFYVNQGKNVLGMGMISKLDAYHGWLLKFLMALPEAPRGTSELLMLYIIETLRNENCHFLTYGIVPAGELGEITGLGTLSAWSARKLFKLIKWIFKLDQRKIYWNKFKPKTARSYVVFANNHFTIQEIKAIIKALQIEF